jgi:hypothetical protein
MPVCCKLSVSKQSGHFTIITQCSLNKSIERATIKKGISCHPGQQILNSNLHLFLYKTMVWHKPAQHYKECRAHFAISATHKEGTVHNIRFSDESHSHLDGIINRHIIQFSATEDQTQIDSRQGKSEMKSLCMGCTVKPQHKWIIFL